jgi:hypothetical protein
MKYTTPQLEPLTPAVDAIQGTKGFPGTKDSNIPTYEVAAYADWED